MYNQYKNTHIDNAEDNVLSMYNLKEYSGNNLNSPGRL